MSQLLKELLQFDQGPLNQDKPVPQYRKSSLVEMFNGILIAMLKKDLHQDGKKWIILVLLYLLFVFPEVRQSSMAFTSFE